MQTGSPGPAHASLRMSAAKRSASSARELLHTLSIRCSATAHSLMLQANWRRSAMNSSRCSQNGEPIRLIGGRSTDFQKLRRNSRRESMNSLIKREKSIIPALDIDFYDVRKIVKPIAE